MNVIQKENIPASIIMFISGVVTLVAGLLLYFAEHKVMIGFAPVGLALMISALVWFLGEKNISKWLVPATYGVIACLYLVGIIMDFKHSYYGLGFSADVVLFFIFVISTVFVILKDFKDYSPLWLKACEILLACAAGACIFFLLFSKASFGYKYAKLTVKDSTEIFYLLLLAGSFVGLTVANSIYPAEHEIK